MNLIFLPLILAALVGLSKSVEFQTPPPTYLAKSYTTWDKKNVEGSRRGKIHVPIPDSGDQTGDFVEITRLDLVGDARARGYAHGALLAPQIVEFIGPKMTKYFADEVLNIDISGYPESLQKILRVLQIKGAIVAPKVFREAMGWVWEKEKAFMPSNLIDEMSGMAEGLCHTLGGSCNVTDWNQRIQEVNMLPELIRMACTAFGAWGPATGPANTLVQLRALDFGGGPFANYTVMAVHRKDPGNPDNAFASVSFPAFVGVITGVSQSGVGVSEKVWMDYEGPMSLQPGKYNGEPDVFVLRDILEKSKSKKDAEEYLRSVNRTFAIWIGIGDYASMQFDLVGYKADSAIVYTDVTAPSMTGQPYINSVAYVDKHPQPSGEGPNGTLPTALQSFYGNISLETTKIITQYHRTGDLHIASYDFGAKEMYLSVGRVNSDGNYCPEDSCPDGSVWMAYNRPYLKFNLLDLWAGL